MEPGGYIAISNEDRTRITQEFQGQTLDREIKFPKSLGAEHPFEFESVEKLAKKYGLINSIVSKIADEIVTDFEIKVKNPNAQTLLNSFIHDTNFHQVIREWVKEGLLKGNGFIEIDLNNSKVRILNSNSMYVKRNRIGKVLEYNQWNKPYRYYSRDSKELITFKPNQIAHITINKIPNDPYGIGIIWSNERVIENLVQNEQDLQLVISRKAGAPYHIKVGQPGVNTPSAVVDAVKGNLQYLRNTVEWVTDGDVDIKAIAFDNLGKSLTEAQMYFFRQLLAGVDIPEVLMGSGQLNEGIARVQLESFKRKITALQEQVGSIIEEKIIRPILRMNNLDEQPEFVWELPTEDDINARITQIKDLINSPAISPPMKAALEIELAKLLGFDDIVDYLVQPKDADAIEQERLERQQEEEIPQPEVPGVKPNANESLEAVKEFIRKVGNEWCVFSHQTGKNFGCYSSKEEAEKRLAQIKKFKDSDTVDISEVPSSPGDTTVKEWVNLQEIGGFNYTDYLIKILNTLKSDPFQTLSAITEADIANGLLTKEQVDKLRLILKDGFRENQTIPQIENNIRDKIELKDRITETGTVIAKENRPNIIARTETVRLANQGLLDLYKEHSIEKVRFLAALSDRTCPICEGLNGQVYTINESYGVIPVHANCRCTWMSIIE